MQKDNKQDRYRWFSFLAYPEFLGCDKGFITQNYTDIGQAQIDCFQKLIKCGFTSVAVSPLHDKDVYDDDKEPDEKGLGGHKKGDTKKEHFHVVAQFYNKKAKSVVIEMIKFNQGLFFLSDELVVRSYKQALRYLQHLDNPEKHFYEDLPIASSNIDLLRCIQQNQTDNQIIEELLNDIRDNDFLNFHNFIDFVALEKPYRLCDVKKFSYLFKSYIDSKSFYYSKLWKEEKAEEQHNLEYYRFNVA